MDPTQPTAVLIIRAVNSHDALLAQLKSAVRKLEICAVSNGSDRWEVDGMLEPMLAAIKLAEDTP